MENKIINQKKIFFCLLNLFSSLILREHLLFGDEKKYTYRYDKF